MVRRRALNAVLSGFDSHCPCQKRNVMLAFDSNKNYQYLIDYSDVGEYDCEAEGCDSICRCYSISDVIIKLDISGYINICDANSIGNSDLEKAIDMLYVLRSIDKDSFNVNWSRSWYGDEVDEVLLNANPNDDASFNIMSLRERLDWLMWFEYGELFNAYTENTKLGFERILASDIVPSSNKNLDRKRVDFYSKLYEQDYLLQRAGKWFPAPIVIKEPAQKGKFKYKLIDGRHKFAAHQEANKKKISVIVLSK